MQTLQLIEAAVSYTREAANGEVKKVTDKFLVDALTFAEAEEAAIKEVEPYRLGEDIQVSAVKKTKYAEVFGGSVDEEYWYEVKANIVTIDEVSGQEKRASFKSLVSWQQDIKGALDKYLRCVKDSISDIEVTGISETPILKIIDGKQTGINNI